MAAGRTGWNIAHSSAGLDEPDDEAACEQALQVIRDLKRNNETAWKAWTIEVTDGDRLVWQIPFLGAA
jgi:hypothetical protein